MSQYDDQLVERVAIAIGKYYRTSTASERISYMGVARAALSALPSRELLAEALDALVEAHDCIASWGGYASSYFQEKHDLEGDLRRARAAADKLRAALEQQQKETP